MKKVTYDGASDAAYIYLTNIGPGEVSKTTQVTENILLDFNKFGQLVGIEVLNASKNLTEDILKMAK